jgi:hypothetical protein
VLEDALSVVPSSTASKQKPFFDAKDDVDDYNNGETFFTPSVPTAASDIRALIGSPKRLLTKRVGFNKTSPLMRPNPPVAGSAQGEKKASGERGLW